jgi:hypothetical protein
MLLIFVLVPESLNSVGSKVSCIIPNITSTLKEAKQNCSVKIFGLVSNFLEFEYILTPIITGISPERRKSWKHFNYIWYFIW